MFTSLIALKKVYFIALKECSLQSTVLGTCTIGMPMTSTDFIIGQKIDSDKL